MGPFFLTLCLSLSLVGSATSAGSPSEPVEAICGRVRYPDLCVSTINSVRKHDHRLLDEWAALTYIVKAVAKEVTALREKIEAFPEDVKNTPTTASAWELSNDPEAIGFPILACLDFLKMTMEEMGEVLEKLKVGDRSVVYSLSAFDDYFSMCQKGQTLVLEDGMRLSRHMSNCYILAGSKSPK